MCVRVCLHTCVYIQILLNKFINKRSFKAKDLALKPGKKMKEEGNVSKLLQLGKRYFPFDPILICNDYHESRGGTQGGK